MTDPLVPLRLTLVAATAALTTACTPLGLFATLSPKDPATRVSRGEALGVLRVGTHVQTLAEGVCRCCMMTSKNLPISLATWQHRLQSALHGGGG